MATGDDNLRALEALLSEFFDPAAATGNERKRQIDELLGNFSQQRDAWQHCLAFMENTASHYVMMYCLTVLDGVINKQWHGLGAEQRLQIRGSLTGFLLTRQASVPPFVRNKLAKLVVDIGRMDWPRLYPEFFSSILQAMQTDETVGLGLVLLQTASEELACPREDLPVARKEELQRLLLGHIPDALRIVGNLLDSVLDKYRPRVSATPPPSPTSRPRMIHGSPLQRDSLIGAMLQSPQTKPLQWVGEAMMPLSAESFSLCHQGLSCLSHLFSWIPLSDMITPSLLSTVFHFAAFGCDSAQAIALSGTSPSNAQQLGMLAMCCINELLAKNCVPADFEDYLLQMFQQTFYLLQKLTKDSPSPAAMSSTSGLDGLDVNFIEKFTEFLRLFVSNHLRRFEGNPNFPVLEFLSLLFKFTFQQTSLHCFYLCLDIWDIFLDYIVTKLGDRTMDNTSMLSKYSDGVMSVLSALLNKMHYQTNRLQLERLDDEEMNDDNETEWQHFLKQCNESIARIAELLPTQVLPVLFDKFEKMTNAYINLEQFIVVKSDNTSKWLGIEDASTLQQLHCVLRDLATMLQTLGRLVDNFISESFIPRLADGKCLINRFLQLATFNKRSQLYTVKTVPQAASVLKNDFIEIYSQTLATLKAFSCWIFSYYLEFGQDADGKAWCVTVVSSIADSLANLFTGPEHQQQVPKKIVQSAAHLLVSLVLTIRPPFLLELPSIAALYSDLGQGGLCSSLPKEVQLLLHRSLLSYLVIRWPGAVNGEQRWDTRAVAHAAFVQQVFASFLQLKGLLASLGSDAKLQEQVKPCIKMSLDILADFVDAISAETKKGKEICYASLQECIHLALALFPTFINHPDVLHDIMNFCYVLVQVLRVQMGAVFTGQMIESFISLLNRDRLAGIIAEEQAAGLSVIERLLQLLELIVQEPGYTFKPLLPKIVSVAIDHIYPLVAEIHVPDVKMPLFTLLSQLLDQNWSYFYKSVLATVSSQAARGLAGEDDGNDEVVERRGEFVNIMRAFFQSFLQPDVTIFRFNLEALEKLNARRKLYSKRIFREEILYQFISVLIQVLLVRSHDLLQEEIVVAIHNMAAVNFDVFFDKFLVQILDQIEYLSNEQKHTLMTAFAKEKDLPSFTANTQRFINDLRYYRLVNLSLPSGTVILAT